MGMRRLGLVCAAVAGLAGCASPGPVAPPPPGLAFAGAKGSAAGNYVAHETGTLWRSETGVDCPVFHWDRPLGNGTAIRLISASCPVPGRAGVFALRDLGRQVIPLAASRVAVAPPPEPLPADPVARAAPTAVVQRAALPP